MFSLKWIRGRQDSGYQKIVLFKSKLLKMDMYLIKYEKGDFIYDYSVCWKLCFFSNDF